MVECSQVPEITGPSIQLSDLHSLNLAVLGVLRTLGISFEPEGVERRNLSVHCNFAVRVIRAQHTELVQKDES